MYFNFFLIFTISTLINGQKIPNNFSNQPQRTNETNFENIQVENNNNTQKQTGNIPKTNHNHRFSNINTPPDVYSHILKQRKAQREAQENRGPEEVREEKISTNIIEHGREQYRNNQEQDFAKNRLLADTHQQPRQNYVEVLPSRTIDYNFTSLGNDTNYLTAFGLRNKTKNITTLETHKDTFITDLKDPSNNELSQNVTKKQVSQSNWGSQTRNNTQNYNYEARGPRNNQGFPRNPTPNESNFGNSERNQNFNDQRSGNNNPGNNQNNQPRTKSNSLNQQNNFEPRNNQEFTRNSTPNEVQSNNSGNDERNQNFNDQRSGNNSPNTGNNQNNQPRQRNNSQNPPSQQANQNLRGSPQSSQVEQTNTRDNRNNFRPNPGNEGRNNQPSGENPPRFEENTRNGSPNTNGTTARSLDQNSNRMSRNQNQSFNISDSEAQGTFHTNNQVPQNNFHDSQTFQQGFPDDEGRSNFGRAIQTPSNLYGTNFVPTRGPSFQLTTPSFQETFPRSPASNQVTEAIYGPPGRGSTNYQPSFPQNVPSVPKNEYGPARTTFTPPNRSNQGPPSVPSRPIGPVGPPESYGPPTPSDNIPQSSPAGSFQSVPPSRDQDNTGTQGYPSFQPIPSQGQPSNTYGSPRPQESIPNEPAQSSSNDEGYSYNQPEVQVPQGGYPSSRPQGSVNEGYPSSRPQGSVNEGYPSSRPQGSVNEGYPSSRPQGGDNEGYPSGRPVPESIPAPKEEIGGPQGGEGYPQRTVPNVPVQSPSKDGSKVHKHIYFHVAPPFEEEGYKKRPKGVVDLPAPEKHYKILFIKTPTAAPQSAIITQNQNEEKTLVYVLVKKPEEGEVNVVTPKPTPPSKPEVFFIRYKNKRDEGNVTDPEPKGYPKENPEPYNYPKPTSSPEGYNYPQPTNPPKPNSSPSPYQYPKPTIATVLDRKDLIQPTPVSVPVISSPVLPLVEGVPETVIQQQVQLPNFETYLTLNELQKSYGQGLEHVHVPDQGVIYQPEHEEIPYGANTANLLLGQYENVVFV